MNTNMIARYLQFLRKSHGYTQDDLAGRLNISRQAVSKWETGMTIPDLDIWLKLSRLYDVTINDILEPQVQPQRITDFEQIPMIPEKELREAFKQFDIASVATALLGASPAVNSYVEKMFPDTDFEKVRGDIGRVRIETVEEMQRRIVSMVNLYVMEK